MNEPKYYKHINSGQIVRITKLSNGKTHQEAYGAHSRRWLSYSPIIMVECSIMFIEATKEEVFAELL